MTIGETKLTGMFCSTCFEGLLKVVGASCRKWQVSPFLQKPLEKKIQTGLASRPLIKDGWVVALVGGAPGVNEGTSAFNLGGGRSLELCCTGLGTNIVEEISPCSFSRRRALSASAPLVLIESRWIFGKATSCESLQAAP